MSHHKYACPNCGQHIEYTDGYSGKQMPCPMCGQTMTFPVVAPGKITSSLRLAGRVGDTTQKFDFSLAGILRFLRDYPHWKVVALCGAPFVVVAAALVVAGVARHNTPPPATVPAPEVVVDPGALKTLTDLTRADLLVRDRLKAANSASALFQSLERAHASTLAQGQAQQRVATARKAFDKAFANYQKLGGTIDYRQQLQ